MTNVCVRDVHDFSTLNLCKYCTIDDGLITLELKGFSNKVRFRCWCTYFRISANAHRSTTLCTSDFFFLSECWIYVQTVEFTLTIQIVFLLTMNVKMGRGDFFFFLFMPRYKIVLNILGSHIPTTLSAAHCPKFKIREQKTPHKISFISFSNELNRQCGQRISTFSSWSAVQLARVQCVVLQPNNLQYEVSFTTLPAAAAIPNSSNNKYLMCVVDRYFIFLLFLCRRIHLSSRLYDYQISM